MFNLCKEWERIYYQFLWMSTGMGTKDSNISGPINFTLQVCVIFSIFEAIFLMKNHIKEFIGSLNLNFSNLKIVSKWTFYEDNQVAILVSTRPIITTTSKIYLLTTIGFGNTREKTFTLWKLSLKFRRGIFHKDTSRRGL